MIYDLAPMARVTRVNRSIEFYRHFGFEVQCCFGEPELAWAALHAKQGVLMLSRSDQPIAADQQAVLFYLYTTDLQKLRQQLQSAGINTGEVTFPFYMPEGEMSVTDPDGYCLLIGQSDCWRRPPA